MRADTIALDEMCSRANAVEIFLVIPTKVLLFQLLQSWLRNATIWLSSVSTSPMVASIGNEPFSRVLCPVHTSRGRRGGTGVLFSASFLMMFHERWTIFGMLIAWKVRSRQGVSDSIMQCQTYQSCLSWALIVSVLCSYHFKNPQTLFVECFFPGGVMRVTPIYFWYFGVYGYHFMGAMLCCVGTSNWICKPLVAQRVMMLRTRWKISCRVSKSAAVLSQSNEARQLATGPCSWMESSVLPQFSVQRKRLAMTHVISFAV